MLTYLFISLHASISGTQLSVFILLPMALGGRLRFLEGELAKGLGSNASPNGLGAGDRYFLGVWRGVVRFFNGTGVIL